MVEVYGVKKSVTKKNIHKNIWSTAAYRVNKAPADISDPEEGADMQH